MSKAITIAEANATAVASLQETNDALAFECEVLRHENSRFVALCSKPRTRATTQASSAAD